jgi:hypothetical protein
MKRTQSAPHATPNLNRVRWPGGHSAGKTPDPIPNSAVKTRCADGTPAQAAEE